MPLLARGQLAELLLRYACHKPIHTSKHLLHVLRLHNGLLRLLEQLLDANQAIANQVLAKPIVHLGQHPLVELDVIALVENGIHKTAPLQLRGANATAHDERLARTRGAQPQRQRARRAALGDEANGGKRREQEGRGRGVDEVGVADQRGREANDGPVEPDDEDLGVLGKRGRDVEVVGGKVGEPVLVRGLGVRGRRAGEADVCAAVVVVSISCKRLRGQSGEGRGIAYAEKKRPLARMTVMYTSEWVSISRRNMPRS